MSSLRPMTGILWTSFFVDSFTLPAGAAWAIDARRSPGARRRAERLCGSSPRGTSGRASRPETTAPFWLLPETPRGRRRESSPPSSCRMNAAARRPETLVATPALRTGPPPNPAPCRERSVRKTLDRSVIQKCLRQTKLFDVSSTEKRQEFVGPAPASQEFSRGTFRLKGDQDIAVNRRMERRVRSLAPFRARVRMPLDRHPAPHDEPVTDAPPPPPSPHFRSFLTSPWRRVNPVRSRCSRSGMQNLRVVSRTSRAWLAVIAPCSSRKARMRACASSSAWRWK